MFPCHIIGYSYWNICAEKKKMPLCRTHHIASPVCPHRMKKLGENNNRHGHFRQDNIYSATTGCLPKQTV